MSGTELLWGALRCPADGSVLLTDGALTCVACGREFRRVGPHAVDMISEVSRARPSDVSDQYWSGYLAVRGRVLSSAVSGVGWGAVSTMPPEWVRLRQAYSQRVTALVCDALDGGDGVVADVSAGAGYVTHLLASENVATLHMDLDPDSVLGAAAWLVGPGAGSPMLAVRGDYFALPLRASVNVVVCTDTLIRGREHEVAVLKAIRSALRPGGVAIVDFHNWLHNPIRRAGLLRDNFAGNRSYFRREIPKILRDAGFTAEIILDYRQEEDQARLRRLAAPLLPPTRFLAVLRPL